MGSPEKLLLERARRFERQALAEIYDQYSHGIYIYAARLLGDVDLAEECVAETFSRLLHSLHAGKGPGSYLQAYLYRIAHNWITDQYRRESPPSQSLDEEVHLSAELPPEQQVVQRIRAEQVRAALYQLTPDQRQVVVLKFLQGWNNEQVSRALEKPVSAVKSLQHRALNALRRMLLTTEEEDHEPVR
jgi:RNA polymerase sigma-70 factor (ECF subfamily)